MHSRSDSIKIMINDKADEIIKELFKSLKNGYENILESMKVSEFLFSYVHLLHYKSHNINQDRGRSYIDSPDWIKNKKITINPIKKNDNKCLQYAVTVMLNYEEIKKDLQKTAKIKTFINKCIWEGINPLSEKGDWKKIEKNKNNCSQCFVC